MSQLNTFKYLARSFDKEPALVAVLKNTGLFLGNILHTPMKEQYCFVIEILHRHSTMSTIDTTTSTCHTLQNYFNITEYPAKIESKIRERPKDQNLFICLDY